MISRATVYPSTMDDVPPPPPYQQTFDVPVPSYASPSVDIVQPPYDDVLPSYEQANSSTSNTTEVTQPPSYESLYGQVRAAKQDSNGILQFLKKVIFIVLSTVGFTFILGLMFAIPVAMIVIGAMYLSDCPRQTYIPIYLIVGGSFGFVKNVSSLVQRIKKHNRGDSDEDSSRSNAFDGTITCFLVAWFIAGNVWVYGIHGDYSSNPSSSYYCHPVLYNFAFWLTTGTYIVFGVIITCICFTGILFNCISRED